MAGGRRGHDFFARLGRVVPEDGDAAPDEAGLVGRLEADFARGQDGLLVEVLGDGGAEVAAALLDEDVLDRAAGVDRDAQTAWGSGRCRRRATADRAAPRAGAAASASSHCQVVFVAMAGGVSS